MKRIVWLISALCALLLPAAVGAHDTRPLYVEITQLEGNVFSVSWKVPITVAATDVPDVSLPRACRANGPATGGKTTRRQTYECETDLSSESISIHYPRYNPSISTLVHFKRLNGETYSSVLPPQVSEWSVPETEQTWKVAKEYMVLGVEHILAGYDHLLFVACLVLISGTLKRILITVTGFTIAHSITLALAALGVVQVAVPPVEAAIALSIVFLATELVRQQRDTLTWRFPIAVSASFGLLHGFGFASVLGEIGLPQTEIPVALLFFNVGVELGQIAFVLVLLAGLVIVRKAALMLARTPRLGFRSAEVFHRPAGYLVGTLAAFWMVERVVGFWA